MSAVQLDLFGTSEILLEEVQQTKRKLNTVRRGMFAQMGELQACYVELKQDIERLERLLMKEQA